MTGCRARAIIYIDLAACHEWGEYLQGRTGSIGKRQQTVFVHRSPDRLSSETWERAARLVTWYFFSPKKGLEQEAAMDVTLLLTQWDWEPSLLLGTAAIIAGYLYAIGPLRIKYGLGPAVPVRRALAFFLGVDVIFFALFSPLDAIGDSYLFSAHMAQHLLLSLVGPPLMLLGLPAWLLQPLLRHRVTYTIGKVLTYPMVAAGLFTANLWLWHAPSLYDLTLVNEQVHILSHLLYIATGLLFWWPLLSPLQEGWPPLSLGGKLAYLFFSDMPMVLLGAGLTFSPSLYPYYQHVPRIFGLDVSTDQQLGGLLMWIVGSIYFIVLASIFFLHWMLEQEEQQRRAERAGTGELESSEATTPR
jgi:putative membrane protein